MNLLLCAVAYTILSQHIIRAHGKDSALAAAVGNDRKGKISVAVYVVAILLAASGYSWVAGGLLVGVACIWFLPDRRIERALHNE